MTGNSEAGSQQALAEVNKQFTRQEQDEDAAAAVKVDPWYHPFGWWDFLLLIVPIAITVFVISWGPIESPE